MIMTEAMNYNRIYVANIHSDITEEDLRNVFMAFGKILKCQLARYPNRPKHRLELRSQKSEKGGNTARVGKKNQF